MSEIVYTVQNITTASCSFVLDIATLCPNFTPSNMIVKQITYNDLENNKTFFMCSTIEDDTKENIQTMLFPMTCKMLYTEINKMFIINNMNPIFTISKYDGDGVYSQYSANMGVLNSTLYMVLEFIE